MLEHEVVAFQCSGIKSLLVRIVARSSHRQLKPDFDLEISTWDTEPPPASVAETHGFRQGNRAHPSEPN